MDKENITLDIDEKNREDETEEEVVIDEDEEKNTEVDDEDEDEDIVSLQDEQEADDDDQAQNVDDVQLSEEDAAAQAFEEEMIGETDMYEDDSDMEEDYLQKLDNSTQIDIVSTHHPELLQHKNEEIETLSKVIRNEYNEIMDPFHKTVPFLTKYEKARVLGERAKQLNAGAKPFVNVEETLIDGYLIAEKELEERKMPFIIKRPITNGGCEYWKLEDLEMLY